MHRSMMLRTEASSELTLSVLIAFPLYSACIDKNSFSYKNINVKNIH